jgi:trimeric autotransporter adhesin
MVNPRQVVRAILFALLLPLFSAASVSLAYGQDFSITPSALYPSSVDPGGSSTATIDLEATGGFDSSVALSCAVVPSNPAAVSPPQCTPSPASQIPPADGPALTITTTGTTSPGLYTITVTGTSGSITHTSGPLALNVVNITEDYTLSVSPTTATPGSVAAGGSATTTVSVTPIGSYGSSGGHMVTLACYSVSPVVAASPYCSFNPPTVTVTSGTAPTSAMTITSLGPTPVTGLRGRRIFYALWLVVPGLALVGVGATGSRRKNTLGALLLLAMAGGLLLMPSCNSAPATNSPNGEITPNNTYTFTLTAADENGAVPSNVPAPIGSTQNPDVASVTLTVTAAN